MNYEAQRLNETEDNLRVAAGELLDLHNKFLANMATSTRLDEDKEIDAKSREMFLCPDREHNDEY